MDLPMEKDDFLTYFQIYQISLIIVSKFKEYRKEVASEFADCLFCLQSDTILNIIRIVLFLFENYVIITKLLTKQSWYNGLRGFDVYVV